MHRGYLEVQEVARLEHSYVEQLRALADASVAINGSLTVEAILQLTADAAREIIRASRATVAVLAPDPRLRPLTATSPARLGAGEPQPARLSANLTRRGKELGVLEVVDAHEREFTARDEAILTQLAQLARSRSPTPSSTTASARSRARCSARCDRGRSRPCTGSAPRCASARPARGSSSAATSTTSSKPVTAPGRR